MNRIFAILFAVCGAGSVATAPVSTQTFPDHAVKVVSAYPPGGPSDTMALP
jgi:tripartite-type tricarboxylate transporter receptor subunit TctC